MKSRSAAASGKLGARQLEAAEVGFGLLLRRKRFSREFRDRHAADLLAQARLEYARHVAAGERIDNPAGWIIHCAWRRTQNALEQESNAPRHVPIGGGGPALPVETTTPEEEVLEADRRRRVQEAVAELSGEQRQVIALTYFEGMSVREASRALGWDKCKGDRRHHAALERLKGLLGASDADALQIEIGIAAWAAAGSRTGPLRFATETAPRVAAELAARAQELARRVLIGGGADPGVGGAAGLTARAAGVCGAAAVACLASGVVGPGLGGVGLLGHKPVRGAALERRAYPRAPSAASEAPAEAPPSPSAASAPPPASKRSARGRKGAAHKASRRRAASATASPSAASGRQVEEEFTPFAGESSGSAESVPTASETGGGGSGGESPGASSPPAPRASGAQVESEFGL